jgi:hypothetical protein
MIYYMYLYVLIYTVPGFQTNLHHGGGFMQVIPMGASMWAGKSIQPYPSTSSADAGRASDMCMEDSRAIYQPLKKTFTSV